MRSYLQSLYGFTPVYANYHLVGQTSHEGQRGVGRNIAQTSTAATNRTNNMSNTVSVLDSLASNFLLVELKGSAGWSSRKKIEGADEVLAAAYLGDKDSFRGTMNVLPAPHDVEYARLTKAFAAVRTEFYKLTVPYGYSTSKDATRADGARLLAVSLLVNGEFTNKINALLAELTAARAAFSAAIPQRVQEVSQLQRVGLKFDPAHYPSPNEVLSMWTYEDITPTPLPNSATLSGMYLDRDTIRSIEARLEEDAAGKAQFGQQSLVDDTAKAISAMADNLTKLDTWFSNREGRRPAVFESLVTNVQSSVSKLRAYALPNTVAGEHLLSLADEIEDKLCAVSADDFKDDPAITARTAREAAEIASKIVIPDDLF